MLTTFSICNYIPTKAPLVLVLGGTAAIGATGGDDCATSTGGAGTTDAGGHHWCRCLGHQ